MRKLFLSAILVMASVVSAFAVDVKVTMNTISTTMTLADKVTGTPVAVGEPATRVYNFTADAGTYILTGYDTDGTTVNGTIELNISEENNEFKIFTITTYATNAGWVYDTDYTIHVALTSKYGEEQVITLGDSKTAGRKTFLALEGSTYYLDLVPTAARVAEGFTTFYKNGTINFNVNAQGAIPEAVDFTLTVPEGAMAFVGRKTAHFVSFIEIPATSVDGQTYHYTLAKATEYNYRVSKPGALTNAGIFKSDVESIVITEENMTAKSPKWIDHDVKNNDGYNVADIFLNINAQEHLKLNQGDTYDVLALRNWEIINTITANYFIEPDFTYTVTNLNGEADNSVVTIDADGTLHAVANGAAIVTVTYDAIRMSGMAGGEYWSAIWPENTGVFVVTVGDAATGIELGMTINETNEAKYKLAGTAYDADFDVFYFLDTEESYAYTFKPTNVASVKVAYPTLGENAATYSGFSAEGITYNNETEEYTVAVKAGRQIVQLTNEAGVSEYQVLVGKPVHVEAIAEGRQQTGAFRPGDQVKVQFSGLYHPANKLAGIHNFNATLVYHRNGTELKGASNQYTFCSADNAQAVSFTIPMDYDITAGYDTLQGGVIRLGGFGDPIGNHRNTSKKTGRGPNFTAIAQTAIFGTLPEIILPLEARPADKSLRFQTNVEDCTITLKDYKGNAMTATEGVYTVNTFDYAYLVEKKGYKSVAGIISVTAESEDAMVENVTLEAIAADDLGWDGLTTSYEPEQEEGVYIIRNGYNMAWLANQVNNGNQTLNAKLANNITLSDMEWTPAGGNSAAKGYKGQFDGQGYTISGLNIDATTTYQALFGYVNGGAISNLTVEGTVTSTANYAAGIAAYLSGATMTNCVNRVEVNGASYAAGITAATTGNTSIDRCANMAAITATGNYAGGITTNTMSKNIVISNCYNTGTITGVNYVAGISANVQQAATFRNLFNYGQIISDGANVGAIRGHKTNGTFEHIYAVQAYEIDTTATILTDIRTMLDFARGVVADSLGEAFGQTIGTEAYPVLGGAAVYQHTINEQTLYLNTSEVVDNAVATMENEEGGIQLNSAKQVWMGTEPLISGANQWTSGDYTLYTYMDDAWGTPYYYAFYASNETQNASVGLAEPYRSAVGGGCSSTNFAVWSNDYYGSNSVRSTNPMPVAGMFVTNNAYTVNEMAHGGFAKKFETTDWLSLVCVGKLAGVVTGSVTVVLARDGKYIKDWTYVDLSQLGQVNEVMFYMDGSDKGAWGLNTPAYFCFDDFGAAMPEGYVAPDMTSFDEAPVATDVPDVTAEQSVTTKQIRQGVLYIIRDGKMYNAQGQPVK